MSIHSYQSDSADKLWLAAATAFADKGSAFLQPSRCGDTIELLHVMFSLTDSRQRWILSRSPALNPAFALAEVVWIVLGLRDANFINYWNPALPSYCGSDSEYHGAYGFRLRSHFGFDQLDRAYHALSAASDSRQVVLQIWDPASDFPSDDGSARSADVPCNVASFLKVRQGRLEWTQLMRSNDFIRGLPHNFVQFTSLQEVISGWLQLEPGSYIHLSDSLQVYTRDITAIESPNAIVVPKNTDRLCLAKAESEKVFAEIGARMRRMAEADDSLSQVQLSKLSSANGFNHAYQNLLYVLGADAARRRGWPDLTLDLWNRCRNNVLREAMGRWLMRKAIEPSCSLADSFRPTVTCP